MRLLRIVMLYLAAGFILPCHGYAETTNRGIRAGFILPLSGPLAGMGEAFRRGTELAKADGKATKIDFHFEDSKYDGKTTLSALHKLKSSNNIDVAIVWGNTPVGVAAPVAETLQLPMIGLSQNHDARGRKYVITVGPSIEQEIEQIYQQVLSWNIKVPAAVSADIGNALLGLRMLESKLPDGLLIKTFAENENDFKTIIASLKAKSVDGLVLFAVPEQGLTFLKQAKQMNFFPNIIGGDVFATDSFQREAQQLSSKLVFVYGAVSDPFLHRIKTAYADSSYFFETACGYFTSTMLDTLASKNESWHERPFIGLKDLTFDTDIIPHAQYIEDAVHGSHVELGMKIYSAQ